MPSERARRVLPPTEAERRDAWVRELMPVDGCLDCGGPATDYCRRTFHDIGKVRV